ncbi:MAG: MinD/ParA family protein [Deltaproteobacteria bacterium]|nr:MAG: MinD/ParA family protein [Deltaproteobacteria bacterium]
MVETTGRNASRPVTACLSSGKGGVGKTSLTVNLAYALAQKGLRVLIVDGDLGLANVDVLLGLQVKTTIRDILDRGADPLEAVIYVEPRLGVLPSSSGVPDLANLGPQDHHELGEILKDICCHFDIVLVDTAAGIGSSVLWFNTFVDYNILVLTPDPTAMTDAYALIKVLSRDYRRQNFHLLVNQVKNEAEARQVYEHLSRVASHFLNLNLDYLGGVPRDASVSQGVRNQVPFIKVAPQSKAALTLFRHAERLRRWASPRPGAHKTAGKAGG